MNRYTIFTLAVLTMLGLGSAQFPGLDFLNFGASPGEPLSPFRESVRIAPGEVTNVGVIPTEKPVFGIIRGELETHKIGGYAIQSDATVVAVPAGELYREGMGLYSGVFAILSSGTDVTYAITSEYRVNRTGMAAGGAVDYHIYKTQPWYNPVIGKTVFILAYDVTTGVEHVDIYLDYGKSRLGDMADDASSESEEVAMVDMSALLGDLLGQAELSAGTNFVP